MGSSNSGHLLNSLRFWRKCRPRISFLGCLPAAHYSTFDAYQDITAFKGSGSVVANLHSRQSSGIDRDEDAPSSLIAYSPTLNNNSFDSAFQEFLLEYPEYRLTSILDSGRKEDFARLERANETYVDYMGGCLYPESLIRANSEFLIQHVLGNTHSLSNASRLSVGCAEDARQAVLLHFNATADYTVIFTPNASAALKLVGEAYPFTANSHLVIGVDSHNSVHGIREFATHRGAETIYIPSTAHGGFDASLAKDILMRYQPESSDLAPCLFVMTGQSNVSNSKNPLSVASYASSLGYHTMVDAAALAPTSLINLSDFPIDAMAISFYKMFGYPTGIGALIVKKSFLRQLRRPWFAGGTVDFVQVPGTLVTFAHDLHEQFEDGTMNYLQLPAIKYGLDFLSTYLPLLPLRLSSLLLYLSSSLSKIRHDTSGEPVVRILSKLPRRIQSIGEQADAGFLLALIFVGPSGEMIPNSFVEYAASMRNISLRTGCMCNPGVVASMLGIEEQNLMQQLFPGVTLQDVSEILGREVGLVRISLGLASNFQDVWNVIQFASLMGNEFQRQQLWNQWIASKNLGLLAL